MTKKCTKCKKILELKFFYKREDRPSGYRSECVFCSRKRTNVFKTKNPTYGSTHRLKKYKNPIDRLYRSCKSSAIRRGIEFIIRKEDIIIPSHCPYLGVELTNILGDGFQDYNPSIDRVDSSKGYIKDNIEIISVLANRMKSTATQEQLINFAHGILKKSNDCKL